MTEIFSPTAMNHTPPKNKLHALIIITRPIENIFVGTALIIAYFMAQPTRSSIDVLTLLLVFLAGYFISAQGMVHNDIVDLEIDKINCPHRALPSGIISLQEAKIYFLSLTILALFLSLLIDIHTMLFPYSFLYALTFITLIDVYNRYLKRMGFWGNATIGFSVFNLFLYADFLVNHRLTYLPVIVGFSGFIINTGREIIKAMTDIEGDLQVGAKTVAVRMGLKNAGILGSFLIILGLITISSTFFIPQFKETFHPISLIILLLIILTMLALLIKLWTDFSPQNAYWVKERIFYVMFSLLLPFVIELARYYWSQL